MLRLAGVGWGLPASDGWDNDGIAPRDFLPGLFETFTPGHYFTYPPLHLALLALITAPITAVLLARAPSLAQDALLQEAIKVPYMTAFALVARLVTVAMSLCIVYWVGRVAERLAGRRAGYFAAGAAALNSVFTYYAQTSNLDVPYMFWSALALWALVDAITTRAPRRLRTCAVACALAVATKDQAYGLFALGVPASLLGWLALDAWPRANLRAVAKHALVGLALAAAVLAVVDGAVTNPSGFRARLAFLAGPASQPFAHYSSDAYGRLLAAWDSLLHFWWFYPLAFAPLALAGLVRAGWTRDPARRAAGLAPLWLLASYTALFICVARREEARFVLPPMILWAIYVGVGLDALFALRGRWGGLAARAYAAGAFTAALFRTCTVDANMLLDPRYDAEAWLAANVKAGETIEVHGKNVYLLRTPPHARTVRVGPEPLAARSRLPGVEEKVDALGNVDARAPRWIFLNEVYAGHFLHAPSAASGRILPENQARTSSEPDGAPFFHGLVEGRIGYRLAYVASWKSPVFPRTDFHGTLGHTMFVYERAK